MRQLHRDDRRRLLAFARGAIESVVCPDVRFEPDPSSLTATQREHGAAFVTIWKKGHVRGCIGRLQFDRPLWEAVRDAAIGAALDDPRFPPLREAELGAIDLEISVLDPPAVLPNPSGFEVGRHGIIVERGLRRAVLLPQVAAEMGWGADEMLEGVCRKAGLAPDAWRDPATRLQVFESVCFSERELQAPEPSPAAEPIRGN